MLNSRRIGLSSTQYENIYPYFFESEKGGSKVKERRESSGGRVSGD